MDSFLLNKIYIPISQFAGQRWGSTASSLSRSCIYPMVVFGLIRVVEIPNTTPGNIAFTGALILGLATLFWVQAGWADSSPNVFEHEPPFQRLFWLFFLFWALVEFSVTLHAIARVFDEIACVSVIYFRAVPKPPPKKRRMPKEVREALLEPV